MIDIASIFSADMIHTDFKASNKDDALKQMADLAQQHPALKHYDAATLYQHLADREAAVSTGLGDGIAIPHARIEGLQDFAVLVLTAPRGIPFDALDGKKVQIFVVLFAPADQTSEHLRLLASISRVLSQSAIRKEILRSRTREVVHEALARSFAPVQAVSIEGAQVAGPQKVLFIILFYEEDLQACLEYLLDEGVRGSIIFEAKGMGAYVSAMPLFAGFMGFMREDLNLSHVIMTVVSAAREKAIVQDLERVTGDLDKKQGAMLLSFEASFCRGSMNMI